MIKKQATNLASIRKGDGIIAKVYKGDTLRYNSAHSITYNLDGIVAPSQTKVKHNYPLVLSFTEESGKAILPSSVIVTMGGTDVTSTAYKLATNKVEIPAVTGDVTITAGAVSVDSAYKPLLYVATRAAAVGNMITLPYKANSNTKLVMNVSLEEKSNSVLYSGKGSIASSSASNPNYAFAVRMEKTSKWWLIHGGTGSGNVELTVGLMMCGQRTTFVNNKGAVSYKNQSGDVYNRTYNGGEWSLDSNLNIMSNGSSSYISDGKLYNVEISEPTDDDTNVLLDYIPIMRLSDGKVGIYDLVNGNAVVNNNYIAPYNTLASGLTNCSTSLLSGTGTGTTTRAVIGSTWSIEIAPSTDATFNHSDASISLFIGGVDVTNLTNDDTAHTPYVQYDSAADTYTITIINVPQEPIEITAEAVALPYDAEVEYLQSDGTAYIDTDIVLTQSHIVDVDFTYMVNQRLFGARKDNSSTYSSFGFYNTIIDLNGAGQVQQGRLTYDGCVVGQRYKVHAENGNRKIMNISGEVLAQNTYTASSFNTARNTPIFGLRWAANTVSVTSGCIHSISISNEGNMLLDCIPVRKDGVGYLYDKVSGQLFGNAGSGAFTFGSDVTSNGANSLNFNNGLLGSINGDEPNETDPIAMEDM